MKKLTASYLVALFLFLMVFFADSYFISYLLKDMPFITHWRILFPTLIPLFLTFGIAALLGMHKRAFWGFLIAYLVIIFLIGCMIFFYFDLFQYHQLPIHNLIDMVLGNLLVIIYIFYFQRKQKQ